MSGKNTGRASWERLFDDQQRVVPAACCERFGQDGHEGRWRSTTAVTIFCVVQ